MKIEELMVACCSDVAGKVRGKAFAAAEFDKRLKRGIGWTPTNVQITCFDAIADSPYGALGDLVMIPDPATRVRLDFEDGGPPEHFVIGDIKQTDGSTLGMLHPLDPQGRTCPARHRGGPDAGQRVRARVSLQGHDEPARQRLYAVWPARGEGLRRGAHRRHARDRPPARYLHEGIRHRPVRGHHGAADRHHRCGPGGDRARTDPGDCRPHGQGRQLHAAARSFRRRQRGPRAYELSRRRRHARHL